MKFNLLGLLLAAASSAILSTSLASPVASPDTSVANSGPNRASLNALSGRTSELEERQAQPNLSNTAGCVWSVVNDDMAFLNSIGLSFDAVLGLFVSGGLLAFGGELSEMAKRIQFLTIALALMIQC
jgi:hypothetical protein